MRRNARQGWIAAAGCLIAGAALCCAPPGVQLQLRCIAADGLRPGLAAITHVNDVARRLRESPQEKESREHVRQLAAEVEHWRTSARKSLVEIAELRGQLEAAQAEKPTPLLGEKGSPLFVPALLQARLLRRISDTDEEAGILNAGEADGVMPAQWALTPDSLAADQGADDSIRPDDPVLAGRAIFGRITAAGRWTSHVQHVSDPGFRIHVRLVRPTASGAVQGAEGLLVGAGNGVCRLELIPGTEPVDVGDLIFTASSVPGVDEALYVGEVAKADLPTGSVHWVIEAVPGVAASDVETVQVVRIGLNPRRVDPESDIPSLDSRLSEVTQTSAEERPR